MIAPANPAPSAKRKPLLKPLFWILWLAAIAAAVAAFMAGISWLKAAHAPAWQAVTLIVVYCAVIVALAILPGLRAMKSNRYQASPAAKRYAVRFIAAMSVYAAVLVCVVLAFVFLKPTGPLAYLLALAPTVPLIAGMAAMGVYLHEETDEFQRAVMVQVMLWAMGGAFVFATVWGFLEQFDLAPHTPAWAIYPLWALLIGPANFLVRARYR